MVHPSTGWRIVAQTVAWSRADTFSLRPMSGEGDRRLRFGYALQMALRARGMSQRQLAKRLNIDPRRVAAFVQGKAEPTYFEFRQIVETLRVSEALFVDLPEIPPEPYYPIERYLLETVESGAEEGLRRLRSPRHEDPDPPVQSPARPVRAK